MVTTRARKKPNKIGDTNGHGNFLKTNDQWLPVKSLRFDNRINRDYKPSWAKRIAFKFDEGKFGVIHVSKRADGNYYVIDGQHRTSAVKLLGWDDQTVPCRVYTGLDRPGEAAVMRGLNTFLRLTSFDDYRIALTEGDPDVRAINRVVKAHGYEVTRSAGEGHIHAVKALEKAYRNENLDRTLGLIQRSWGKPQDALNGAIIYGLSVFLTRYPSITDADLARRLASVSGGPLGLLGRARSLKEIHGSTVANNVAAAVVLVYNKGRRTGALESWWAR